MPWVANLINWARSIEGEGQQRMEATGATLITAALNPVVALAVWERAPTCWIPPWQTPSTGLSQQGQVAGPGAGTTESTIPKSLSSQRAASAEVAVSAMEEMPVGGSLTIWKRSCGVAWEAVQTGGHWLASRHIVYAVAPVIPRATSCVCLRVWP